MHWRAGKHIYCEKPMTHTVEQARRVVAKVKACNLKMQVGVQGMSDDSYITAHKYIQEGTLGKIVLAQIDYSRNHKDDFWAYDIDADAAPATISIGTRFSGPRRSGLGTPTGSSVGGAIGIIQAVSLRIFSCIASRALSSRSV